MQAQRRLFETERLSDQEEWFGRPGCRFCILPATIRVDGEPFCNSHACAVFTQSLRDAIRQEALKRAEPGFEEGFYARD